MSPVTLIPLVLGALLACTGADDDPTFGGGGSGGGGGDGGAADDTGGGSVDPDAPVISSIEAEFYNPPQQATVIEVYVHYEDAQPDVDGGKVQIDVATSDGDEYGFEITIDGAEARLDDSIEGSPVWFWLCGGEDCDAAVDTSLTYDIAIQLKDAAGNWSEEATATVQ